MEHFRDQGFQPRHTHSPILPSTLFQPSPSDSQPPQQAQHPQSSAPPPPPTSTPPPSHPYYPPPPPPPHPQSSHSSHSSLLLQPPSSPSSLSTISPRHPYLLPRISPSLGPIAFPPGEAPSGLADLSGSFHSNRPFPTQFKKWDFPSKQGPAHLNEQLVARVQQLWQRNTTQKQMLRVLHGEGYEIKERELMRLRARHGWLLRVPNGMKPSMARPAANRHEEGVNMQQLEQVINAENEMDEAAGTPEPPEEVKQKRQERMAQLKAESDERWRTRKRRRRTRGWAGLPADDPGVPPRFPSETTIDEAKAYLHLNNELYRAIRDEFTVICEQQNVMKKTLAGPTKWQAVKDLLISQNAHLQEMLVCDSSQQPQEHAQRVLALDVICTDVTKRMRTLQRRTTIAEAKNVLGINPEESRQIRHAFYAMLKADHFTSKLEDGNEHWEELKRRWIAESPLLTRILSGGAADPVYDRKLKCIEVLCRDVMKRLRDDTTKKDPTKKKQVNLGPGPGPAPPRMGDASRRTDSAMSGMSPAGAIPPSLTPQTVGTMSPDQQLCHLSHDFQIDPNLFAAAAAAAGGTGHLGPHDSSAVAAAAAAAHAQVGQHHQFPADFGFSAGPTNFPPPINPTAAAMDLNGSSTGASLHPYPCCVCIQPPASDPHGFAPPPKAFFSQLLRCTIEELRYQIASEYPGTLIWRIHGIVKDPQARPPLTSGSLAAAAGSAAAAATMDVRFTITNNEEMSMYLSAAAAAGSRAIFDVQLINAPTGAPGLSIPSSSPMGVPNLRSGGGMMGEGFDRMG